MTYINNFDDVGRGDVAVAGGKGVGLGGLSQGGLPVPPGFVLNTAAYADFVAANHLEAGIHELAALSPHGGATGLRGSLEADPRPVHRRNHAGTRSRRNSAPPTGG